MLLLLWLPTLDTLLNIDSTAALGENRRLAGFPSLSEGFSQRYLGRLEAFFNDHFGFRRSLIYAKLEVEARLGLDEPSGLVVKGRNNWLYITDSGAMENYRGRTHLTEAQLSEWKTLLEQRQSTLAARGIKYLFVIAPDKQEIYPEYLPARVVRERNYTALDEFLAYMRQNCAVRILDLRKPLTAAKQHNQMLYYKSDTHWNLLGACVASQAIVSELTNDFPRLRPASLNDFEWSWEWAAGGDMARLLGLRDFREQGVFSHPRAPLPPPTIEPTLAYNATNIQVPQVARAVTTSQTGWGRALVFRDSFGHGLIPFLGNSFSNAVYLWTAEIDQPAVDSEKPDVVISEMCERLLLHEIQNRSSTPQQSAATTRASETTSKTTSQGS
jgi:alginate O-acetyltransferase complex protein AlgJ